MKVDYRGTYKCKYVHDVFSIIATKYDILNSLFSFNRDKYWRAFAIQQANVSPGDLTLDVASGTGMMALEQAKVMKTGHIIALDFCYNMEIQAKKNIAHTPYASMIECVQGNALKLPFADHTFQAVTIGFGLRNMSDYKKAIAEMVRVVRPGGKVVSLDLGKPHMPIFKQLYYGYFELVLPFLGRIGMYGWPLSLVARIFKAISRSACDL